MSKRRTSARLVITMVCIHVPIGEAK